jgi:hypothetical protein
MANKPNPHITPDRRRNPQYAAAFHIFDTLGMGHSYVGAEGINAKTLLRDSEVWSSSERIMVRIALELFNPKAVTAFGYTSATFGEAIEVLDDRSLRAVIEAIQIACGVSPTDYARK